MADRSVDGTRLADTVECVLERGFVGPAIDEVAMEAIACGVAVGEDEVLVVGVDVGEKKELVEEREERNRVGLGAVAALVVAINVVWVGDLYLIRRERFSII